MKDIYPPILDIKHGHGDAISDGHDPVIHGVGDGIKKDEGGYGADKVGAGSGGISTEEG